MNAPLLITCAAMGCACGGGAAACIVFLRGDKMLRAQRRNKALGADAETEESTSSSTAQEWALGYAERLTRRLFVGSTEPIAPSVRAKRAGETRTGKLYLQRRQAAGCAKTITVAAFCEACMRLAIAGSLAGIVFGALFSIELALLLGIAGALAGRMLPIAAVRKATRRRSVGAELHLSEMLEVVALGLRSGMTFDRSFSLYGAHFDNEFAQSCAKAHRCWAIGLMSREDALRELADSYDCEQLTRVIESIVRSLRFGSALAGILEEASEQARATYRATLEERVAKAPVKMMLPTGTLILPAMLLMVMGPVLLELISGF